MQEILLYAFLALIVGSMLYSVLGKDVGHGSDDPMDPLKKPETLRPELNQNNNLVEAGAEAATPKFTGPGASGLEDIFKADSSFSAYQFLDGAKQAYGLILEAYADGDKPVLDGLLNKKVKADYFAAIDAREEQKLSQTTDLARIISSEIIGASKIGKTASISVLFTAELATALLDASGETVSGDLDILSKIEEVWQFERTIGSKSPNWILSSVAPHEILDGDTGGPDHSPDTE